MPPKEPQPGADTDAVNRWAGRASVASARSQLLAAAVTIGMLCFTLYLVYLAVQAQEDTTKQIGLLNDQVRALNNQQQTLEEQLNALNENQKTLQDLLSISNQNQEIFHAQLKVLNKNQEILSTHLKAVLLGAQPVLLIRGHIRLNRKDPNKNDYWIEIRNSSENIAEAVVLVLLVLPAGEVSFEEVCRVPCGTITAENPYNLQNIHLADSIESGLKDACGVTAMTKPGRISIVRAYCIYRDKHGNLHDDPKTATDVKLYALEKNHE